MYNCVHFPGPEPEGELQVSVDVHPGVKGRLQRSTTAQLSRILKSLTQQQPRQVMLRFWVLFFCLFLSNNASLKC